jgi:hypothetical protein
MRLLLGLATGLVVLALAWSVAAGTVFQPAPAATRLAGVSVGVAGYTIDDLGGGKHRLHVQAAISSLRDLDECLGFTLDEPFAGRRLSPAAGTCARPRAGRQTVELVFVGLTEDDLRFPSHTLVWGIPGGRCGPILLVFGVCVVEQAGTAALELPGRQVLPSLTFGSFGPLFSFPPP